MAEGNPGSARQGTRGCAQRQRELVGFRESRERLNSGPRGLAAMRLRNVAVMFLALVLGGCASMSSRGCATGEQPMASEMLYFGTQTPRGAVTPEQWAQFLATVVTPRFPQGLTVWPASGQWRSADGTIVREASYALTLLHADDAASETAIRAIVDDYKTRFHQEAVLRVKSRACTSL